MAELDLRPVRSCIPAHSFFRKFLFRLENQGFHFISPNFIVFHIFFIVKFVSSFDSTDSSSQVADTFDPFLFGREHVGQVKREMCH